MPDSELTIQLVHFFGRFHVLAVHLPIGLFFGVVALHLAAIVRRTGEIVAWPERLMLALTAISAIVTALLGLMLVWSEAEFANDAFWHKWAGVATAIVSPVVLWVCVRTTDAAWPKGEDARPRPLGRYRLGLVVLGGMIGLTGHLGGSLTHGENYLFTYAPFGLRQMLGVDSGTAPEPSPTAQTATTARVMQIFENNCFTCHGPDKQRAKLRFDVLPAQLPAGHSGHPAIIPGDPWSSEVIRRITLPADDLDAMPPEGRDRVPPDDVIFLMQWIYGYQPPQPATDRDSEDFQANHHKRESGAITAAELADRVRDAGGRVKELPDGLVRVDLNGSDEVDDETLAVLAGGGRWVASLNLADTRVSDTGIRNLPALPNLRDLDVSGTHITDVALERIAKFPRLAVLNLSGLPISDDGLMWLADASSLTRIDLTGTRVTEDGAESFQLESPDVVLVGVR